MIIQVLHCPHCQSTDIVRHGTTRQGKQRYRCRPCRQGRGRTFLLDYAYAGHLAEVKQQIVEMAMGSVSKVDMETPTALIYKMLFPSFSTFETPPTTVVLDLG